MPENKKLTDQVTKVDIVLLRPPVDTPFERFNDDSKKTIIGEPLGLALISSFLKASGIRVAFFDSPLENWDEQKTINEILALQPRVIGVLARYPFLASIERILSRIRSNIPEIYTIAGGQYATLNPRLLLDLVPSLDSVGCGDGEDLMLSVMMDILNEQKPSHSRLFSRKPSASSRSTASVSDLNTLPWADRKYLTTAQNLGFETVGITSSRGCPFRCSFCVPHIFSRTSAPSAWRARSVLSIADEIEHHWKEGNSLFTFSDEHFLPHKEAKLRAVDFADTVKYRNMEIEFMFDCRADSVEHALFAKLKRAGLMRVFIGFETLDSEGLLAFQKDLSSRHNLEAVRICKDLEIELIPGMIFFHPWATPMSVLANLEFHAQSFELFDWDDFTTCLKAIPGTPIVERIRADGLLGNLRNGLFEWSFKHRETDRLFTSFNQTLENYRSLYKKTASDKLALRSLKEHIIETLKNEVRNATK
ncbi:B12-binding domain-containing radical SAM protein [Pseudomonas sp. MN1F]|uniref:B12-binding domain-containing radical SAM protein n=1 Tax=Pseudomonas sp. MN1F TaxID=1366632 RepID=UPI00128FB4E3|nr:radical SAM protein [Pseudomonas sp. MN1F]MQG92029.1 B12-binding domain-containing radical SAM protein [Pseudomonas sp. MN1F]